MQFQDRHLRPWFNGDYLAILTGQGCTVAAEPRKLHYRPMTRRVVISGAGPISALGVGIDDTWSAMREGRSGLKPLTCFDPGAFPCHVGGEVDPETFKVRNVVPKSYRKAVKVMCRDVELAVARQPSAPIIQTSGAAPRILPSEPKPTTAPASVPKIAAG